MIPIYSNNTQEGGLEASVLFGELLSERLLRIRVRISVYSASSRDDDV